MKKLVRVISLFAIIVSLCAFGSCGSKKSNESTDENVLTVVKTSSHEKIRTAHPGEDITYTFTVKNGSEEEKNFEITDCVPESTSYKSGDASVDGEKLSISVKVSPKSLVTFSYTVTVTEDRQMLGTVIESDSAEFLGTKISCSDIYIERTFNEYDMQKLAYALYAMKDSEMTGKQLLNYHYVVAFSCANPITHEAPYIANSIFLRDDLEKSSVYSDMVVPGLYGGKSCSEAFEARFLGKSSDALSLEDIFCR